MRIGIITFHWATNYGAVLQAYALQTCLKKMGHEVYIINYRPTHYKKDIKYILLSLRFWRIFSRLKEFIKERKIESFRKKYLNETISYGSQEELKNNPPDLDAYICGSDQIWNPTFTTIGEGVPTTAYFLDFGKAEVIRIAYAVSFGTEVYPDQAAHIAKKCISGFNAISVREKSGLEIVKKMGIDHAINLPDPTLLLSPTDYFFNQPPESNQTKNVKKAFVYVLRDEQAGVNSILEYLSNYSINKADRMFNPLAIEEWLKEINDASIVITNSFHGMVFSILFHVPFIVIPASGGSAGMNDRFNTLLSALNLTHRMINDYSVENLDSLLNEEINWQNTELKLLELRNLAVTFFDTILEPNTNQ